MRVRSQRRPLLLALAALLLLHSAAGARKLVQADNEATALLSLPAATTNWAAATAGLPGAPWQRGTPPCGQPTWAGVTCGAGQQVTAVDLSGLGLAGTLPPALLQGLPGLQALNLSANALSGSLPAQWASSSLATADLSENSLTGALPPEWLAGAFAQPLVLGLRPGNPRLCGLVPPVSPQVYSPGAPAAAGPNNTLIPTAWDLFTPGSAVTITNWLGSCARPCNETGELQTAPAWVKPAGLTWPPSIQTNAFDLSFTFNFSMSDLLLLNPGLSDMRAGARPALPCYPWADKRLRPDYYGSDVALGHLAGGHQSAGLPGVAGAMAAARAVERLPGGQQAAAGEAYTGSLTASGGGVEQPVYFFVDLLAPFQVTSVFLTAGSGPLRNASVYIGNDSSAVQRNALIQSGLSLEPGQQLGLPASGAVGRYVLVSTGSAGEGQMSLADVQVYAVETNAAANKPVTVSSLRMIDRGGAGSVLQLLADNNQSSCVAIQPDPSDPSDDPAAWAFIDLGYSAPVVAVAVAVSNKSSAPAAPAQVLVSNRLGDAQEGGSACLDTLQLQRNGWAAGACNRSGRYVTLRQPLASAADSVDVCELQVYLAAAPELLDSDSTTYKRPAGAAGNASTSAAAASSDDDGGSSSSSAIAGIVVGATLGAALLLAFAVLTIRYTRFRRRWIKQHQQVAAALTDKDLPTVGSGGSSGTQTPGPAGDGPAGSSGEDGGDSSRPRVSSAPLHPGTWELLAEFAKSLRPGSNSAPIDKASSAGLSFNISLFPRAKSGTAGAATVSSGALSGAGSGGVLSTGSTVPSAQMDLESLPAGINFVSARDVKLLECVGEGSYGQVWTARYYGTVICLKIFRSGEAGVLMDDLKREAALMSTLRHPNGKRGRRRSGPGPHGRLCRYLGATWDPPGLLMEYCSKRSLDTVLEAALRDPQAARSLPWDRLLAMAVDAANGMLYLHTRDPPIAHRDLKSGNLLVDAQMSVKVADFSLSRALHRETKRASTVVMANPRWLAPEVLGGEPGQLPADVWAYGTILWELLTWKIPFDERSVYQIIMAVQKQGSDALAVPPAEQLPAGTFPGLPAYLALMRECRAQDPAARPRFKAIVERLSALQAAEAQRLAAPEAPTSPRATTPDSIKSVAAAPRGSAYSAYAAALQARRQSLHEQRSGDVPGLASGSSGLPPGGSAASSLQPGASAASGTISAMNSAFYQPAATDGTAAAGGPESPAAA